MRTPATKCFTGIDLLYHSFIRIRPQDVCLRSQPSSDTIYAHEVGIECEVCNTIKVVQGGWALCWSGFVVRDPLKSSMG